MIVDMPADVEPGDSIGYSQLNPYNAEQTQEVHEVPYCSYGDYDNSTALERSNYRVMRERFPELVEVHGGYDSHSLYYIGKLEDQSEELREAIDSLDAYPVADESDMSELEMEMEWEAWNDWGRKDFARDLVEYLNATYTDRTIDLDDIYDGEAKSERTREIDELWHKGTEAYNLNGGPGYVIESGGNVWFMISDWIKGAKAGPSNRSEWGHKATTEVDDDLSDLMFRRGWLVPGKDSEADIYIEAALTLIAAGWE